MTFLAPIAGIIAAAIAVPLLALFYFLKLRRQPVRISSTLLWERAVQDIQANAPFRWLRPSLLLLIQLLALACLIVALARPAISAADEPVAGRTIIVIDRSASMSAPATATVGSAPGGDGVRLDAAQDAALDVIDRLSSGGAAAQAMVIAFASDARLIAPFTNDRVALRRAVRGIEPTDQPADFEAALRLIEAQAMRALEDDAAAPSLPRVVLISDGSLPRHAGVARAGVSGAEFRFIRVGPEPNAPRDNVGVVALSAKRDYEDPSLVRLFFRLQSVATESLEIPLRILVNGEPSVARTLTLPPAAADQSGALVPGEAAETIELRAPGAGVAIISIARPDGLAADNEAGVEIDAPRAARIVVVGPTLREAGASLAETSLLRALEEITLRPVARIDAGAYERFSAARQIASDYDLVVFDGVRPGALPPIPSISFGAALPIPGLRLEDPDDNRASDAVRFVSWLRSHPIMRAVSLDAVVISQPLRMTLPDPEARDPEAPALAATPLASGPDGPLIAHLESSGLERVVVAFPLARSTWPLQPSFIIFLVNAVERLARVGQASESRALTTRDPVSVRAAPGAQTITVTGPLSLEVPVPPGAANEPVAFGPLPRVGAYRLRGVAGGERTLPISLLDPGESAIATADHVDVAGKTTESGGVEESAPREVWRWFVLAAAALATLEWLLFAWRTRV